jgi:hypothetical protein
LEPDPIKTSAEIMTSKKRSSEVVSSTAVYGDNLAASPLTNGAGLNSLNSVVWNNDPDLFRDKNGSIGGSETGNQLNKGSSINLAEGITFYFQLPVEFSSI